MLSQIKETTTPEWKEENKSTIQSFLYQSYSSAKKQLGSGIDRMHDGVSFIKDELSEMYNHRGYYFQQMTLPVNNFLKDLSQIETELKQEICKESAYFMTLDGKKVPCEQVLSWPMEENY